MLNWGIQVNPSLLTATHAGQPHSRTLPAEPRLCIEESLTISKQCLSVLNTSSGSFATKEVTFHISKVSFSSRGSDCQVPRPPLLTDTTLHSSTALFAGNGSTTGVLFMFILAEPGPWAQPADTWQWTLPPGMAPVWAPAKPNPSKAPWFITISWPFCAKLVFDLHLNICGQIRSDLEEPWEFLCI